MKADLHCHSTCSDGKDTPAELVARAVGCGLSALALTDHDTVAGVGEAMENGVRLGVEVIAGVEFSTRLNSVESHIVGLWVDPSDRRLLKSVARFAEARRERAIKMLEKLTALGAPVSMEAVETAAAGGVIGRPHLAKALVDAGHVATFREAFQRYIGKQGPAYHPKMNAHPSEAIDIIHRAGGVAVLAHPLSGGPQREHVALIAAMGLDGIETVHPKLDAAQSKWLDEFAARQNLAVSGGSDWHGPGRSEGNMGEWTLGMDCVRALHNRKQLR